MGHPAGREEYEERPSVLLHMARAAHEEDPAAFDAFLLEQLASSRPNEALSICDASDAPAVTEALRARLANEGPTGRALIAERLAARGHRDDASAILTEMLNGPGAGEAALQLMQLGSADALEPTLAAIAAPHSEAERLHLRNLAVQLAGFNGRLHRTIEWSLWDENPRVRAWGIAALRHAMADRAAGRP